MKKFLLILVGLLFIQNCVFAEKQAATQEQARYQKELNASKTPYTVHSFYETVATGDCALVEKFLKAGMNPNAKYIEMNAISAAITTENMDMLNLLLKYGADPNKTFSNWTPLNFALWHRNDKAAIRLVEAGADINTKSTGGTPLDVAVQRENLEMTKLLYDKGAAYSPYIVYVALQSKNEGIQEVFAKDHDITKLKFLKTREIIEEPK